MDVYSLICICMYVCVCIKYIYIYHNDNHARHHGKSFRLARKGLDKDIDPQKSKVKIKDNRVVIMLKKIQGNLHFENIS